MFKQKKSKNNTVKDAAVKNNNPVFLDKTKKKAIKLMKRVDLSHDSAVLKFDLDTPSSVLGLPVGKHFKLVMPNQVGTVNGEWNQRPDAEHGKEIITRSYTPISGDEKIGKLDLLVKFYKPGVVDRFPDGGKVSRQLDNLKVGEEIFIQGPFGRVEYKGCGKFKVGRKEMVVSEVGMMAGGSGITPMLQIIRYALIDPKDKTKFSLIYANQTEDDILVRSELEEFSKKYPERFKLNFTIDRPTESWKFSKGFITDEMIKKHLPGPSEKTLMLMCGPPPMVKFACRANMEKLGYSKESQIEF